MKKSQRIVLKAWKVLIRVKRRKYRSCIMGVSLHQSESCEKAIVTYRVNEWAKPHFRCGPLAVFRHRCDARRFASERMTSFPGARLIVKPCLAVQSSRTQLWFWTDKFKTCVELRDVILSWPGTVLADAVKLLPDRKRG